MRRAMILVTLALLLLGATGITVAHERSSGPQRDPQTDSTVQRTTANWEYTELANEESTQRIEPAAIDVSTGPEVDELETGEDVTAEDEEENAGNSEGVERKRRDPEVRR